MGAIIIFVVLGMQSRALDMLVKLHPKSQTFRFDFSYQRGLFQVSEEQMTNKWCFRKTVENYQMNTQGEPGHRTVTRQLLSSEVRSVSVGLIEGVHFSALLLCIGQAILLPVGRWRVSCR